MLPTARVSTLQRRMSNGVRRPATPNRAVGSIPRIPTSHDGRKRSLEIIPVRGGTLVTATRSVKATMRIPAAATILALVTEVAFGPS
jgi:hypothetical protein